MSRKILFLLFFMLPVCLLAQKSTTDSLYQLLSNEKNDADRVDLMCELGYELRVTDPRTALTISSEALSLAKKIKYADGEARSLGTMAILFRLIGNFPLALEYNIKRLKLAEQANNPEKLAGTLMNIAIVYVNLEDYNKALDYYYKADSVVRQVDSADAVKFKIALNTGDVYDKLLENDSAFNYFNKSLNIARSIKERYYEGMSMIGLGNNYLKTGQYLLAMANYKSGVVYLQEAEDDDLLCEAFLGLATLHTKLNNKDSALAYARLSLNMATKAGFLPRQLEAVKFLSTQFRSEKNMDSSFYYMNYLQNLNDTINSKGRIRETQVLSSNEQVRQLEIAENLKVAKEERKQQLQLLFIALFIPAFFMFTLLLSRIKIPIRVIKIAGILSLLILFEYLTLLLHPFVKELTHHTPVYEMLIFVAIAAVLIPLHHRVEHWLIKWLTKNRPLFAGNKLKMKRTKITVNYPQKEED